MEFWQFVLAGIIIDGIVIVAVLLCINAYRNKLEK